MTIRWTPEMDAAVVRLSSGDDQLPFDIAAERIGVCTKTLLNRQRELGIFRYRGRGKKPLDWTDEMVAELRATWPKIGMTIREIAGRLKISSTAVAKKAGELGLGPKPDLRCSIEENDTVVLRYIARHPGCHSAEIISASGLSKATVYNALRRLVAANRCRRRSKPMYFANTGMKS